MKFTKLWALILSLPFNETSKLQQLKEKSATTDLPTDKCTNTNISHTIAQIPTIYKDKHEQYVKINKNIFATYTKLNNDSLLTMKPAHPSPKLKLASKLKT